MLPDQLSNPGPLTYESDAQPMALRGPAPVSDFAKLCAVSPTLLIKLSLFLNMFSISY